MNKNGLILILSILVFGMISCDEEIVEDGGGIGKYFINNQSSYDFVFKTSETTIVINAGETKLIGEDSAIGMNVPPSESILELTLYRVSADIEVVAYEQIPVNDNLWLSEKQDDAYYGLVHYILTITDDLIK